MVFEASVSSAVLYFSFLFELQCFPTRLWPFVTEKKLYGTAVLHLTTHYGLSPIVKTIFTPIKEYVAAAVRELD